MDTQTKDDSLLYLKMINKTIILLTVMLFLTSCSANKKFTQLMKGGVVQQKPFKVEIPFEYRLGLIIIKVELNNETYDFVLDSGATNVLSKELAETLGKKRLIIVNNRDVHGNYQPMGFTKIKAVTIGGIKFEETASGIGDFNQSIEVGCLGIDGIIGANLMRLAVWEIDFKNQIITITNTKESLALGAEIKKIPFYTNSVHQPLCNVKVNAVEEKNVTIDLGSNGGFSLSYNTYEKIQKELPKNKKVIEYGYHGSGFYGSGKIDSIFYLQANKLLVGGIRLDNQLLKFSKSSVPTIGTSFFKNYDLVMNWADNEILLTPHTDYDNQKFTQKRFTLDYQGKFIQKGFTLNYRDDALSIASLIKESEVEQLGIQLGDKIIQIDGKDYSNTTIADYCDLIKQVYKYNSIKNVMNVVINRNGEHLSFNIKKDVIIE